MQQIGFAPRCCQLPAVVIAIVPILLIWSGLSEIGIVWQSERFLFGKLLLFRLFKDKKENNNNNLTIELIPCKDQQRGVKSIRREPVWPDVKFIFSLYGYSQQ